MCMPSADLIRAEGRRRNADVIVSWPDTFFVTETFLRAHGIPSRKTNISQLGKRKNKLQKCLGRGYVSSLEGNSSRMSNTICLPLHNSYLLMKDNIKLVDASTATTHLWQGFFCRYGLVLDPRKVQKPWYIGFFFEPKTWFLSFVNC